jgi:hypothetical protein
VIQLLVGATLLAQSSFGREYIYLGGRPIAVEQQQDAETISTPATPSGTSSGTAGTSYTYTTSGSSSSLGHSIQYRFDWGDGTNSGWLAVGTTQSPHSWAAAGTYSVTAQARCASHTFVLSSTSSTFSASISDSGWPNGYSYRRAITIDHTKVANTDQSNFPVLVSGTYSYLATVANGGKITNSNGYDIAFYSDANGNTPLYWEMEKYSATDGAAVFWVKVPTLSHTTDTVIYLFYGNSSVNTFQSTASSVWDSSFVGVWHLTSTADSTNAQNNLNVHGTTSAAPARIGTGRDFGGSGNYLQTESAASLGIGTGDFTMSLWVTTPYIAAQWKAAMGIGNWSGPFNPGFYITGADDATQWGIYFYWEDAVPTGDTLLSNTWYYLTVTRSGTSLTFTKNGSSSGLAVPTRSNAIADDYLTIGSIYGGFDEFDGIVDEVRVSNSARSGDWIAAEYANQSSPNTFYAIGAEQ